MKLLLLSSLALLLLTNVAAREYHYNKPESAPQQPNYAVRSEQVYQGYQPAAQQQYAQPGAAHYAAPAAGVQYAAPAQQAYHHAQHVVAQYSGGAQYQQPGVAQYAQPAQYSSPQYSTQYSAGGQQAAGAQYAAQPQYSAASRYSAGGQYNSQYQQQGFAGSTPNRNPFVQPQYTPATRGEAQLSLPIQGNAQGQPGGSASFNGGFGHAGAQDGHYISQSEGSVLDVYPPKQEGSDTRPFARHVTTCNSLGQCNKVNLAAGQPDNYNSQVLAAAHARVAPVSEKCKLLAEKNGSYAYHIEKPKKKKSKDSGRRPRYRRLFPYSDVIRPRNPWN